MSEAATPCRVAVLLGGDSPQRAVSLASGQGAADGLLARGHRVQPFDMAQTSLADIDWAEFDVALLALHGGAASDGRLQQQLGRLGVCYTGSDATATRLAGSKSASKERFRMAALPTLDYLLFDADQPPSELPRRLDELGFPLVVKPDAQGASLGVSLVAVADEFARGVAAARQFEPYLVVEPWVDGREFSVTLLDRQPLPLLEIVARGGIFDYAAKYAQAPARYRFDHRLPIKIIRGLQRTAVAAADALGTGGLVQVDLLLDRDGKIWVLEVNTTASLIPGGITSQAAGQAGISLGELCQWMVQHALRTRVRP